MRLLSAISDRLLGLQQLQPLHQAILEPDNVAAAVVIEGQQQKPAQMHEQQHTRLSWRLPKLALHQCWLRPPLRRYLHQAQPSAW